MIKTQEDVPGKFAAATGDASDPGNAAAAKEEARHIRIPLEADGEMNRYGDDEADAYYTTRGLSMGFGSGGGRVEVPPPTAPAPALPRQQRTTTNLAPGAVRVRGISGRSALDEGDAAAISSSGIAVSTPPDQRTASSSRSEIVVQAELVRDAPMAQAESVPEPPWWSKRRNACAMASAIVLLAGVVVALALLVSGSRGDDGGPSSGPPANPTAPNATTADEAGAAAPTAAAPSAVADDGPSWVQLGKTLNGDAASDRSGTSVALSDSGAILAVGANRNDGPFSGGDDGWGGDTGHVRVHRFDAGGGDWDPLGGDVDGTSHDDWSGYSVDLSADGRTLAAGAPGSAPWDVRVHRYQDATEEWAQVGRVIEGEAGGARFGASVALSADGRMVAVGASFLDGGGSSAGRVRVYRLSEDAEEWVRVGKDLVGEAEGDYLGFSVALSADGNVVAAGAPRNDNGGVQSGHVRIHRLEGGEWRHLTDIVGRGADAYLGGDNSGIGINSAVSLSANGTMVAVGAPHWRQRAGYVQVYRWDDQGWVHVGQDLDGSEVNDWFGTSVSLSGNGETLAIGARQLGKRGDPPGYVRVFRLDNLFDTWLQLGQDLAGEGIGDRFGYSVDLSLDGHILAVGAPQNNNANGEAAGHVRVFRLEE